MSSQEIHEVLLEPFLGLTEGDGNYASYKDLYTNEIFELSAVTVNKVFCMKEIDTLEHFKWELKLPDNEEEELLYNYNNNKDRYSDFVGYYNLVDFGIPYCSFLSHPYNLLAMFKFKTCKEVPLDQEQQIEAYKNMISTDFILSKITKMESSQVYDKSWEHLLESEKKSLYYSHLSKSDGLLFCRPSAVRSVKRLRVQVKDNECIIKSVPRPVNNQGLDVTLASYGVSAVADHIKKIFNWRHRETVFVYNDRYILYTYVCGGTMIEDLSDWLTYHRNDRRPHIALVVSGDDSYLEILWGPTAQLSGLYYYEGDLSACDQTIRLGPLNFTYEVYSKSGLNDKMVDLLRKASCSHLMYSDKYGHYRINNITLNKKQIVTEAVRQTGGNDTSIGNSLVVLSAWLEMFFLGLQPNEWSDSFHNLGFSLKLDQDVINDNQPYTGTFLKGRWVRSVVDVSVYYWVPLLGRIFKGFKTMTHPEKIVNPRRKKNKYMGTEASERYASFMHCALCSQPHDSYVLQILSRLPEPIHSEKFLNFQGHGYQKPEKFRREWKSSLDEALGYISYRYNTHEALQFLDFVGDKFKFHHAYLHAFPVTIVLKDYAGYDV